MQHILKEMEAWRLAGRQFAVARVLSTWGSAPRQPGAAMLISADSKVIGSVSSGCVESDLIVQAQEVLDLGRPRKVSYGVPDEKAWSVGLSCGGQLTVWVEPFWGDADPEGWQALLARDARNAATFLATPLATEAAPPQLLDGGFAPLRAIAMDLEGVRGALAGWRPGQSAVLAMGEAEVFVQHMRPRSRVIILGAGHIAVPLVRYLDILDMQVLVIDPRAIFTDPDRFGITQADIRTAWPQEIFPTLTFGPEDYIVLLTHDPRIDDPALQAVLRSPVAYIGALGSKKSHEKRVERLQAQGFTAADISRIHAPIGLKLGGVSPAEIALSIVAEVVKVRCGGAI